MSRARRILSVLLAALTAVVLAACASIPTSGPVERGGTPEEDRESGLRYYPSGPFDGASREEIVQGFLDAGTGAQNDFATAREYLAPDVAEVWQPVGRVYVTDGQTAMKTESAEFITVSVQVTARVDADGNYRETIQPTTEQLKFRLAEVDGQWRITEAPDGIVVTRQPFTDLFEPRTLYQYSDGMKFVTPDLRWFLDGPDVASDAVRALIQGPSEWLATGGAVLSAFPQGVELREPVTVEGGFAVVDLTEALSTATPEAMKLVRLQLEKTLLPITEAAAVEIRINGAKVDVALPDPTSVIETADVNSSPLVLQQGRMGYLSGGQLTVPVGADSVAAAVSEMTLIRGTLSASRGTAAFLSEEGTWAMHYDDQRPELVDARPGQIEPVLDNWDYVWTQSTTHPGLRVGLVSGGAARSELELPPEIPADFISFQVSRDTTRLAVLYERNDRIHLAILPIIREGGRPVELGEPLLVDMPGNTPLDVAWVDANTVAMLVQVPEGTTDVRIYRVGGELTSLGTIENAAQIAGSNTLAGMRVVDVNGILYAPRGTGWRSSDTVVSFLFAQV